MKILGQYIQYSKIFTSYVGFAYLAQVCLTIFLVYTRPSVASALLEILKTTTGLVGLVFGCYSGNSVVEKYVTNKRVIDAAVGGSQNRSSTSNSTVG